MLTDAGWGAAVVAALDGHAAPWAIAFALAATTLLVEDLAIAAGAALAAQGSLSWGASFAAVAGGIALGDVGLYALGVVATRLAWLRRRIRPERGLALRERLVRELPSAVLIARVVPGLRLVTYTASGWLRVPLGPFCAWVALAVAAWTAGLYALSAALGRAIVQATGLPPAFAVALPVVVFALAIPWFRTRRVQSASMENSR